METIKEFDRKIEIEHLSIDTHKAYRYHIQRFRRFYGDNLTIENMHRHLHYLTQKGYMASSVNIARASLIYYANKILKKNIDSNAITPIKRAKPLPKPIPMQIVQKIIENTKNLKHKIVLEVLYGSGLRLGEVVRIKWDDIDFSNNLLRVNKGKGNKDRIVKIGNYVIDHLLDYKAIRENKASEYVFDSMARPYTHISKKTVQAILKNSCKAANIIQKYHVHQLRHSYATHSLEAGVDIRKIQEALGHSSPKTTMIYTKVTKDTIKDMISPLDLIYQNKIKGNNTEKAVTTNTRHNS